MFIGENYSSFKIDILIISMYFWLSLVKWSPLSFLSTLTSVWPLKLSLRSGHNFFHIVSEHKAIALSLDKTYASYSVGWIEYIFTFRLVTMRNPCNLLKYGHIAYSRIITYKTFPLVHEKKYSHAKLSVMCKLLLRFKYLVIATVITPVTGK